jgi:hypothetical protein
MVMLIVLLPEKSLFGMYLNNVQKYYAATISYIPTFDDIFDYHCSLFQYIYDYN